MFKTGPQRLKFNLTTFKNNLKDVASIRSYFEAVLKSLYSLEWYISLSAF